MKKFTSKLESLNRASRSGIGPGIKNCEVYESEEQLEGGEGVELGLFSSTPTSCCGGGCCWGRVSKSRIVAVVVVGVGLSMAKVRRRLGQLKLIKGCSSTTLLFLMYELFGGLPRPRRTFMLFIEATIQKYDDYCHNKLNLPRLVSTNFMIEY